MNVRIPVLLVVAILVRGAPKAEACATAPPRGAEATIAEEEAVIVWDAEHHTEHFIRRAAFYSTARSFGFLVPTPAMPELGEIDDSVFWSLANQIAPEVRYETKGWSASAESWLVKVVCSRPARAVRTRR